MLPFALLAVSALAQASTAPVVTSLSPNGVTTSSTEFGISSFEIIGSNFAAGDIVEWTAPGGQTTSITPVVQTPQEMSVSIPGSATATAGMAQLAVVDGTAVSNTVSVPIAPFSLFSVTPAKASAGSGAVPVTISGVDAIAATTLIFTPPGGNPLNIPLGAGGTATIPANALLTTGAAVVALTDAQGDLSDSLPFTILPSVTPAVTLSSSVNPALTGQAVTLTASISPVAASGTIVFFDGAAILGSATLLNGQAVFTTHLAGAGLRSLRAFYTGTTNYAPSSSVTLAETLRGVAASTFQPAVAYPTGNFPTSAVQADLNNDGKPDLAVLNMSGNSVSVLIGNGDGSFQKHVDYATASPPLAIAAGDLNGDGIIDLAVVGGSTPSVSLFFGNGDGTFRSPVILPVPPAQFAALDRAEAAITDMNGDGLPDLVINLIMGQQIAVLIGNGDGTFQPPVFSASNTTLTGIREGLAVADFNDDGNVDVLDQVVNGSEGFYIMNGRGNGDLYNGTFFAAPFDPFSSRLATADFNGDGKLDIAASGQSGGLGVMLGDGTEHFVPKTSQGSNGSGGLAVGDFNGDGIPDLFQASAGNVTVWEGNGDGTFAQAGTFATGNGATSVLAADFNGDGIIDLAVLSNAGNTVNVLLGGTVSGIQTIAFPAIPNTPLSQGSVTVSATASSGLPVSFSSNTTSVCTVSGVTVTLVSMGVCEVVASQAGNAMYAAASPVAESFSVEYQAQPPLPAVTGIANAASAGQAAPWVVAPGSYVAIYGTNLAGNGNPNATPGSPLPTTLNGTQVLSGNLPMPLLYAAPGQINAVIPQGLPPNSSGPLIISNQVKSAPVTLTVKELQPGIYTMDTSGSGVGVVADAVTGQLITSSNPAHAGENLVIYATGLGPLKGSDGSSEPADGAIAPSNVLYRTTSTITVSIGGVNAPVSFSGLIPTLTALYQINVQMPAGVTAGTAVPVVVTAADSSTGATASSNQVTIAVQ